jgi:hypothetical protein
VSRQTTPTTRRNAISRRNKQTSDIHLVAYFLDPQQITEKRCAPSPAELQRIHHFLELYGSHDPLIARMIRDQLLAFLTGEDDFSPRSPIWQLKHNNNAQAVWGMMKLWTPELAKLAYRIFITPANSVPSERAFSSYNLQHDKKRSKLTPENTDRLCFIHVNRRILDRTPTCKKRWEQLDEEELAFIEEELLGTAEDPVWIGGLGTGGLAVNLPV